MKKIQPYASNTEYHLAQVVASAIAARCGANPNTPGYQPNPMARFVQVSASEESVQDALNIINGFDIRRRISQLLELNDTRFFNDVRHCLQDYQ